MAQDTATLELPPAPSETPAPIPIPQMEDASIPSADATPSPEPAPTPIAKPSAVAVPPPTAPIQEDSGDALLHSFIASAKPKAPATESDDIVARFMHESAPELARKTIDEYKSGKLDLDDSQVDILAKVARDGVGPWQSLGRGAESLWEHRAEALQGVKGMTKLGMGALDQYGRHLADPRRWISDMPTRTQGAAKGLLDFAPMVGGVASELGDLITQPVAALIGLDPTSVYARLDAGTYKAQHLLNKGAQKVAAATDVNPESPDYQVTETAAPFFVPLTGGQALSKAGDTAINIAGKAAGKAVQGAAKTGRTLGPAALAAVEAQHGNIFGVLGALGTLAAGYGPEDAPIFGRLRHALIDPIFTKTNDVGRLMAHTENGSSFLATAREDMADEIGRYQQQLKDIDPEAVAKASQKTAKGTPVYAAGDPGLTGDAKQAREIQDKIAALVSRRDSLLKYQNAAKVITAGARDLGLAGGIGSTMMGSTAAPGDYKPAQEGLTFGLTAGLIGLPFALKGYYMDGARRSLAKAGENVTKTHPLSDLHAEALKDLPPEEADTVHIFGGMAATHGGAVIALKPEDFVNYLRSKGETIERSPDGFYDHKTRTAVINSEALHTNVLGHEVTHLLSEAAGFQSDPAYRSALDEMLSNKDLATDLTKGVDTYRSRLAADRGIPVEQTPALSPRQLRDEITSALAVDLFSNRPPEAFYGGKTNLQVAGDWLKHRFAPTGISQTSQFGFPVTPEMRTALSDLLFKAGKQADKAGEAVWKNAPPDSASGTSKTTGAVAIDPGTRADVVSALQHLQNIPARTANEWVDQGIAKAQEEGAPLNFQEIIKRSLPRPAEFETVVMPGAEATKPPVETAAPVEPGEFAQEGYTAIPAEKPLGTEDLPVPDETKQATTTTTQEIPPAEPTGGGVEDAVPPPAPVQTEAHTPETLAKVADDAEAQLRTSNPRAKPKQVERARLYAMARAHAQVNPDTDLVTHRLDRFGGKETISGQRLDPSDPFHADLIKRAGLTPDQVNMVNGLIGKPVSVEYQHAPASEAATATTRKAEQQESGAPERVAGEAPASRMTKSFVGTGITFNHPSNTIEVNGFSPDKFLNNAQLLLPALKGKWAKAYDGVNDPLLAEDLSNKIENNRHGYTAMGKPIEGTPITPVEVDPEYTPHVIPKERADIVNALIGDTSARKGPRGTSMQAEKQILARRNSPFFDESTGETNHLRSMLGEEAGQIEPTFETVRPELVDKVGPPDVQDEHTLRPSGASPEQRAAIANAGAPRSDFSAAGFQPSEGGRVPQQVTETDQPTKKPYPTTIGEVTGAGGNIMAHRAALMGYDGFAAKQPDGSTKYYKLNVDELQFQPGEMEADEVKAIKNRWAAVNNELLQYINKPNDPEAIKKYDELRYIANQLVDVLPRAPTPKTPTDARQVVVVGGGPSGMATAISNSADGVDVMLLEGQVQTGGQSRFSSRIENYPGFPIGITGRDLARDFYNQSTRLGAEVRPGVTVDKLDFDPNSGIKTLTLSNGEKVQAHTVVLAGGMKWRHLQFPGSNSPSIIYGNGEMVGMAAAGKPAVIIGGSNGAAQAALGAARKTSHVYLISRSPIEKGMSDYQIQALNSNPKITIMEGDEIAKLNTDANGKAVSVETKKGETFPAASVGIFAGGVPNSEWMPPSIRRSPQGFVEVNQNLETSVPGVFAIGDIRQNALPRIGAAVGDGQRVARNVYDYLEDLQNRAQVEHGQAQPTAAAIPPEAVAGEGTGAIPAGNEGVNQPGVPVRQEAPRGAASALPRAGGLGAQPADIPPAAPEQGGAIPAEASAAQPAGQLKFQPSDLPDAIKEEAVKMPDGMVFSGASHADAQRKAFEHYNQAGELDKYAHWLSDYYLPPDQSTVKRGFLSNKNEFVNEEEADKRAKKFGQINSYDSLVSRIYGPPEQQPKPEPGRDIEQGDIGMEDVVYQPSELEAQHRFDTELPSARRAELANAVAVGKTPAFKKWFGASKVVNAKGEPLVLYHQTAQKNDPGIIDTGFDTARTVHRSSDILVADGVFMKPQAKDIGLNSPIEGAEISQLPLFAKIENPRVFVDRNNVRDWAEINVRGWPEARDNLVDVINKWDDIWSNEHDNWTHDELLAKSNQRDAEMSAAATPGRVALTNTLKKSGYDGMILSQDAGGKIGAKVKTYIAFDPKQVKSALFNRGTFDPNDPRIQFQPSGERHAVEKQVVEGIRNNGGITVNLQGKQPSAGFAFATSKESERKYPMASLSEDNIRQYLRDHRSVLEQEGAHVGGWNNGEGEAVIDVSVVHPDQLQALIEAKKGGQDAIYDLKSHQEIRTDEGLKGYSAEEIRAAEEKAARPPQQETRGGLDGFRGSSGQSGQRERPPVRFQPGALETESFSPVVERPVFLPEQATEKVRDLLESFGQGQSPNEGPSEHRTIRQRIRQAVRRRRRSPVLDPDYTK